MGCLKYIYTDTFNSQMIFLVIQYSVEAKHFKQGDQLVGLCLATAEQKMFCVKHNDPLVMRSKTDMRSLILTSMSIDLI